MKTLTKTIYTILAALLAMACASSCGDNTSGMMLDGDTRVESLTISGHAAEIDHVAGTIKVSLPTDTDLGALSVDDITLSPGATCDLNRGSRFNGNIPQPVKVVNGDVSQTYTLFASHDNVEILTFTLNARYSGAIDNEARTILVFVPVDADVTAMQVSLTATDGAQVTPASGSLIDFSSPVEFTASYRTATAVYTVTVIQDEMSQAPKAFVGNASSIDGLGPEAQAAARWMMENVPNSHYVALQSVLDGSVILDDYAMVWAHLDFTDWPGVMWDTRDTFNSYWLRGGAILATRDGARYINDVWRIARNQQSPNNMFGGENYETLQNDLGIGIAGNEGHPLFDGIETDGGRILLAAKGMQYSNRTLQWLVDRDGYSSMADWEEATGAKALASNDAGDSNCVTIAEFEPYEALKGSMSGRVITIGSPAYEWHNPNGMANPYKDNMEKLTKNAINHLCQ